MNFTLLPGHLTFADIKLLLDESTTLSLDHSCHEAIQASTKVIENIIQGDNLVYGVNTGFGALANTRIEKGDLESLQQRIVLSHAAGTGDLLSDKAVRLILALKINSLARGYSGIRLETIEALIQLFNAHIYPTIPAQGSVGASGDLAPLAHLSAVLLGFGHVRFRGQIIDARTALAKINLQPLTLAPKEGLALLNGTQACTALSILALLATEEIFISALTAGALTVDATCSSDTPFDERIQIVRGHSAQSHVAKILRQLLDGSEIRKSHVACTKVQDPYSIRCQPQVMGACLQQYLCSTETLLIEANAVSDNPIVFTSTHEVLSGGNFHAQPVAFAADNLALCIAEIGALSERRVALLMDPTFSNLPAFLTLNAGLNSGFMVAHVTTAALASENKQLSHPSSTDSIPTSANQEDHVSMSMHAARRLLFMVENTASIVGIELLAACQGIDFLRPLHTSKTLENVYEHIRKYIAFYDEDRYFAPDIASVKQIIQRGEITTCVRDVLPDIFHF